MGDVNDSGFNDPNREGKSKKVHERRNDKIQKNKDKTNKKQSKQKFSGCFIFQGPHRSKDCPKLEKLNFVVCEDSNEVDSNPTPTIRVNPLQLLNSIRVIGEEEDVGVRDHAEALPNEVPQSFSIYFLNQVVNLESTTVSHSRLRKLVLCDSIEKFHSLFMEGKFLGYMCCED
ncbi:hypothetical protein CFOL_v3_35303 [Cephalotus follicularis]|uniref:Uncharacterized protein n=1 Tax=Cephalotus follicularis TaxID=3775 RepID=A0A1Q3DI66_CEPFO|nr:hypothetical protein CFOL_v3_35303 [Cephalotus follicularis]